MVIGVCEITQHYLSFFPSFFVFHHSSFHHSSFVILFIFPSFFFPSFFLVIPFFFHHSFYSSFVLLSFLFVFLPFFFPLFIFCHLILPSIIHLLSFDSSFHLSSCFSTILLSFILLSLFPYKKRKKKKEEWGKTKEE